MTADIEHNTAVAGHFKTAAKQESVFDEKLATRRARAMLIGARGLGRPLSEPLQLLKAHAEKLAQRLVAEKSRYGLDVEIRNDNGAALVKATLHHRKNMIGSFSAGDTNDPARRTIFYYDKISASGRGSPDSRMDGSGLVRLFDEHFTCVTKSRMAEDVSGTLHYVGAKSAQPVPVG